LPGSRVIAWSSVNALASTNLPRQDESHFDAVCKKRRRILAQLQQQHHSEAFGRQSLPLYG